MSGKVGTDVYAAVDLSKKKKNRGHAKNPNGVATEFDNAIYDQLNRDNFEENEPKKQISSEPLAHFKHKLERDSVFTAHGLKLIFILLIVTWVILAVLLIMVIIVFVKDSPKDDKFQGNISTQQSLSAQNIDFLNKKYGISVNSSISNIYNILDSINTNLSSLQQIQVDNYLSSCSEILRQNSTNPSGQYIVRSSTGALTSVYCDMNNTFGNNSLGWMRIAKLNVYNCPENMTTDTSNIVTCVVNEDDGDCIKIGYSVYRIPYSKVVGRIRGYQIGTPDGFTRMSSSTEVTENYVDGIRLMSNGEHIWTFAAGCSCGRDRPPFVGDNYSCERHQSHCPRGNFCDTLLWESQNCGEDPSPWFSRTLPLRTDDVQVHVCRNQGRDDEDIALQQLELYVQ